MVDLYRNTISAVVVFTLFPITALGQAIDFPSSGSDQLPPRIVLDRDDGGEFKPQVPGLGVNALAQRVAESHFQRLIIGLEIPMRSDEINLYGSEGSEMYRQLSDSAQKAFLSRIEGKFPPNVINSIELVDGLPYVIVPASPHNLTVLLSDSGTVTINTESGGRPLLNQSSQFIGANVAHGQGHTGSNQAIAIIDTGVDRDHPMLMGTVVSEGCYSSSQFSSVGSICRAGSYGSTVTDSGGPCIIEDSDLDTSACAPGHGTTVASIAAGKSVSPGGGVPSIKGIAYNADIISLMAMTYIENNTDLCGTQVSCYRFLEGSVADALSRVNTLRSSFHIPSVNMSFLLDPFSDAYSGATCDSAWPLVRDAVNVLVNSGTAVVAASGNTGQFASYQNKIGAPACLSKVTSVGATAKDSNQFQSYSNAAEILDLLAPGGGNTRDQSSSSCRDSFLLVEGIWSAYYQAICLDSYMQDTGTSMASPHVAAAYGLLKSRYPDASLTGRSDWLKQSGVPVTFTQGTTPYTKPRIALDQAMDAPPPPSSAPANSSVTPWYCFGGNDVSWDAHSEATEYQVQGSKSTSFTSPWNFYRGPDTFIWMQVSSDTYIRVRGCNTVSCGAWAFAGEAKYFSTCF